MNKKERKTCETCRNYNQIFDQCGIGKKIIEKVIFRNGCDDWKKDK